MVWILVVALVLLGVGWYMWAQQVTSNEYAVPAPATEVSPVGTPTPGAGVGAPPRGQTQVNTNPNGPDYQPLSPASSTPMVPTTTGAAGVR